jgi:hypothetical protein
VHEEGSVEHLGEAGVRNGIEIEVEIVRPIHVITSRVPRIEVDASQIHDPEKRRKILNHRKVDDVPRAMLDRARLDPFRSRRRRALHEEPLALRTIRIALHHHSAVPQVRKQDVRHISVVLKQVAFGDSALGPENLRQVGELHRAPVHIHDDIAFAARDWKCPRQLAG